MAKALSESNLDGVELSVRGKVRDVYDLGDGKLLIVASDRISAFDSILGTPIPGKGKILNQITAFWFRKMTDIIDNHFVTDDVDEMGHGVEKYRSVIEGRSMLVHKAEPLLVECVVRGYLAGSGWKEYQERRSVCGIPLAKGYRNGSRLLEPLFTPATKARSGHDKNISFDEAADIVGKETITQMRDASIAMYKRATEYAMERGIIIADTKFEFGTIDGKLMLIDEVLTPDSSRFWPSDSYTPGKVQLAFDKQFVRDYLEASGWDKQPPGPELPKKIVTKTLEKYIDAYRRLTGQEPRL